MAHSQRDNLVSPEAIQLGYEPEMLRARGLLWFCLWFLIAMVVLQALLWWVMGKIEKHDAQTDLQRSVLTLSQQPPPPNLQPSEGHDTSDYQDLQALRNDEDALFARLGWKVDSAAHEVEIPEAIVRVVAERQRARAAGSFVPPTTTGRASNPIMPTTIPAVDTVPTIKGGQRP